MHFSNYLIVALLFTSITSWSQKKTYTKNNAQAELRSKLNWPLINSEEELLELIDLLDSNFDPRNEEYFSGHLEIAMAYSHRLHSIKDALYHLDLASITLRKNYPFRYSKTPKYSSKQKAAIDLTIQIGQAYQVNGFPESAIKILEGNKELLKDMTDLNKFSYYACLSNCYTTVGEYNSAIEILSVNRNVFERFQTNYYSQLFETYFKGYQYNDAIPYGIKLDSTIRALNESIRSGPYYTDDLREYLTMAEQIDRNSSLVLSFCKAERITEASQFATGLLDKACFDFFNKDYSACKQKLIEARYLIDEYEKKNTKLLTSINFIYNKPIRYWLTMTEFKLGNFATANAMIMDDISKIEQNIERNFTSFSESQRKEVFIEYSKALNLYNSFLTFYSKQNPDAIFEMLNTSLRSKGLILDITRKQESLLRNSTDQTLLKQIKLIRRYRDKQAAFATQASQALAFADSANRYSGLINEMQRKLNERISVSSIIERATWQDIQKMLKPEEIFVEIVRFDRESFLLDPSVPEYWAFVVKSGEQKPIAILLGQGKEFEERQLKFYQNYIKSQLDDNTSYDVFWKKIADVSTGSRRIYLSADGLYQIINPLTLFNPVNKNYLLNEIELVRVATGRDMLNRKSSAEPSTSITLVGNPDFSMSRKSNSNSHQQKEVNLIEITSSIATRSGFTPLPGTQKETDLIANQSTTLGLRVALLQNTEASEFNVKKANESSILHIATHGEFDNRKTVDAYLKSKLILAGAGDAEEFSFLDYEKYEDGLLSAYEVTQMNLENTRLVVLSACETALGEVQSGEGVWGLQRAFQLAGAYNVMGSLWKISDDATVTFMDAFYKSYLAEGTASRAYLSAMNATKAKYPHPYYWGAFILNGN